MATIKGTNSAETKTGSTVADLIYGYGGNDSLYGRAGNDTIWGGLNDDRIWGEAGNDILRGEDGIDTVYGGDGNDSIYGGFGNDTLYGDGGTDTIYGEAGNDIIKGGTGISRLSGGEGNDTLYYDPTTSPINAFGSYFDTTTLDGGSGTDTLNIFNKSTYSVGTSTGGTISKDALTVVWIDQNGGHIRFMDHNAQYDGQVAEVGSFKGVEKVVLSGAGGANFISWMGATTAVGTSASDLMQSMSGSDIFDGGLGDDRFYFGGGNDTIISGSADSDEFHLEAWTGWATGASTVKGFNGAGVAGGDKIYIEKYEMMGPESSIREFNGKTTFTLDSSVQNLGKDTFTFDAIGLKQDVDYFFI